MRKVGGARGFIEYGVLAVGLFTVPLWVTGQYQLHVLITVGMLSIPALGAGLLMGGGLWSFGQGVFMTIGAYTAALAVMRGGLSSWIGLGLAGIVAASAAGLVGYPALRLKGVYFSILTMILVFAVREVIIVTPGFTGGASGIVNVPPPNGVDFLGVRIRFESERAMYYLIMTLLLISLVIVRRLMKSRLYWILSGIRQSDVLAESIGINVARYKVLTFVAMAFLAGIAGGFSAQYLSVAHPEVWGLWPSVFIVVYAIVGGMESAFGPILGTATLVIAIEVLQSTQGLQVILLGMSLIVVMFVLPGGLISLRREWRRLPALGVRLRHVSRRDMVGASVSARPGDAGDVGELSPARSGADELVAGPSE